MEYIEILKTVPFKKIMIGYEGFIFNDVLNLETGLNIHSKEIDAENIFGANNSDWPKSWFIIGQDISSDDPVFIDTEDDAYPVYVAVNDDESWDPILLSPSLIKFIESLKLLKMIEREFYNFRKTYDINKMENKIYNIQNKIEKINNDCNMYYWGFLFEHLREEIEDIMEFDLVK